MGVWVMAIAVELGSFLGGWVIYRDIRQMWKILNVYGENSTSLSV